MPETPVIPGYTIERILGVGGMGMVHLALHQTLQRKVALKIMRADLAGDPLYAARFLREARAAARVSHPAVVQIHDAGEAAGHLYLAMEFLPGGDFRKALADGPLAEAAALDAIIAAAAGMAAIHRAGLVHRDLKPENLLRDADGLVKIGDLGLARPTHPGGEHPPAGNEPHVTAPGDALGTPAYMAPEQAQGAADLDARCDVYGLAATLYTLLTARPPFSGPTTWSVVHQVISAPPPDPRAENPAVSGLTAALVQRAMAKERLARPASMDDFAAELTACRAALSGAGPADLRHAPTKLLPAGNLMPAATLAPGTPVTGKPAPPPAATTSSALASPAARPGIGITILHGFVRGLTLVAKLVWAILRLLWWIVGGILECMFRLIWRGWVALSMPWRLATLALALVGVWLASLAIYTQFIEKHPEPDAESAAANAAQPSSHTATTGPKTPGATPSATPSGGGTFTGPAPRPPDPDQNPFHEIRDAIRGSLVKDIAGDVPTYDAQVTRIFAGRNWPVKKHQHNDDGSSEISAKTDDDATVTVNLDPLAGGKVRVHLRVGAFGDQARQKTLFNDLFP
jgi:serine/threonine protein kinase